MPVDPKKRNSKAWLHHEWELEKKRDEKPQDAARARARYAYDKAGIDRKGKDIDHKIPLGAGGSADLKNTRLLPPSENRSFPRKGGGGKAGHKPVKTTKRGRS